MYFAEADTPARVRTMNLNEDLGQVHCSHPAVTRTNRLRRDVERKGKARERRKNQ